MSSFKRVRSWAVLLLVVAAGCSRSPQGVVDSPAAAAKATAVAATTAPSTAHAPRAFASLPDRGELLAYPANRTRRDGAYTWHRADISESYALRAIADGHLRITTPAGQALDFKYDRHVEHPSGDWTWIGHVAGHPEQQSIITFGEHAAFGLIAQPGQSPLRLTVRDGVSWLVETNGAMVANLHGVGARPTRPDFFVPPKVARPGVAGGHAMASAPAMAAATAAAPATVDVVLGYTQGFAADNNGNSGANTRLNYLVDIANTTYRNSGINIIARLVATIPVTYTDTTSNESMLEQLTGTDSSGTPTSPDPAFNAVRAARDKFGADLVSVVRSFKDPENGGCGIAWLIGGGQSGVSTSDSFYGYSVVSDGQDVGTDGSNYYCLDQTLAHEMGHNMGAAHDVATAKGSDGVLDASEYGAYPYSFGYKTTLAGNFYTVMAYGDSGQTGYLIFSNPNSTFCGGHACGTSSANNTLGLNNTASTIASFRPTVVYFSDVAPDYWAYDAIKRISVAGVTTGCGDNTPYAPAFCPEQTVTRDQMAVFMLKGMHGGAYLPPTVANSRFGDVPAGYWALSWIDELAQEGITGGCSTSPPYFCPSGAVSRAQMAVFLLHAKYGSSYVPPAAHGTFQDVPTSYWAAAWIEKLASDGITSGCSTSPPLYCPDNTVSRAQMAVFLQKTFAL